MKDNFAECLAHVLQSEGGFVNDPRDPGGATNFGITIGTLKSIGIDVDGDGDSDIADLKGLRPADLERAYRLFYWDKVRGDDLPAGVDLVAFDAAVHAGPRQSAKWLQRAAMVPADGVIGPVTIKALNALNRRQVINAACDNRLNFLRTLPTFGHFGKGWTARVARVRSAASLME